MPTIEPIETAIASLYRVFGRYPPRTVLDREGKPCQDNACLLGVPLSQLPWNALQWYAFKALSLWGDEDTYRYFLPRMLELTTLGGEDTFNQEYVYINLMDIWRRWPEDEQQAIAGLLAAMWGAALRSANPAQQPVEDVPGMSGLDLPCSVTGSAEPRNRTSSLPG